MGSAHGASMVTLNGDDLAIEGGTSLGKLIEGLTEGRRAGMAAAVNGTIVPRSHWDSFTVSPGDRIEVLSAAQGG